VEQIDVEQRDAPQPPVLPVSNGILVELASVNSAVSETMLVIAMITSVRVILGPSPRLRAK